MADLTPDDRKRMIEWLMGEVVALMTQAQQCEDLAGQYDSVIQRLKQKGESLFPDDPVLPSPPPEARRRQARRLPPIEEAIDRVLQEATAPMAATEISAKLDALYGVGAYGPSQVRGTLVKKKHLHGWKNTGQGRYSKWIKDKSWGTAAA